MEKLGSGTTEYIEKESKRCALTACHRYLEQCQLFFSLHRLESILSNLASAKLDELKIKVNILKSFVTEPAEEASKETISREEAEL